MRNLVTVALLGILSGCTERERDTRAKDRPSEITVEVKRSDKELILDAVLNDILNNPDLKSTREFYGAAEDRRLALVTNRDHGIPWPEGYQPILPGWTVIRLEEGTERDPNEPHLLGVRIDKFSEKNKEQDKLLDSPIEVTILNAGGNKNGAVIGGCSVYYRPKQIDGKWAVQFEILGDP